MRKRGRWWLFWALGLVLALLSVGGAGCGVFAEQPVIATPTAEFDANALRNGGFENGPEPWYIREGDDWVPFTISDTMAHTGTHSMKLELRADEQDERTRIVGAIQRIDGEVIPEYISGYYYVDHWDSIEPFQYLQFVVSVQGGDHPDGGDVHQIRVPIAGTPRPPFQLSNAQFLFLSRDDPKVGEWTYFSYPILDGLRTRLGWDPAGWDYIEVFFEARYDAKTPGTTVSADVYYDDLYMGPHIFNPNRPPDDD